MLPQHWQRPITCRGFNHSIIEHHLHSKIPERIANASLTQSVYNNLGKVTRDSSVADNMPTFSCWLPPKAAKSYKFSENSNFSRSSIFVSIESAYATPYWSLIVTLDVSSTVFEILTFKARKWLVFPTPPLFDATARGKPLEFLD